MYNCKMLIEKGVFDYKLKENGGEKNGESGYKTKKWRFHQHWS